MWLGGWALWNGTDGWVGRQMLRLVGGRAFQALDGGMSPCLVGRNWVPAQGGHRECSQFQSSGLIDNPSGNRFLRSQIFPNVSEQTREVGQK